MVSSKLRQRPHKDVSNRSRANKRRSNAARRNSVRLHRNHNAPSRSKAPSLKRAAAWL